MATKEAEETAKLCFKYLKSELHQPEQKEILNTLAQEAYLRSPKFTAANIFEINISTLFDLFGSVISYVIVLIQFNK